jgi:hypothetical protein
MGRCQPLIASPSRVAMTATIHKRTSAAIDAAVRPKPGGVLGKGQSRVLAATQKERGQGVRPASDQVNLELVKRGLGCPVRGHQTGLADHGLGDGVAQAGRLEIRPGLLGTADADRADVEPVGLGQRLRRGSFDLRRKTREKGQGGGDTRGNGDGGKSFDHDGPQRDGHLACRFACLLVTMTGFAMPSREANNGFIPSRLCFVASIGTKQLA